MDTLTLVSIIASVLGIVAIIVSMMRWIDNSVHAAILEERNLSAQAYAPRLEHVELRSELKATREAITHLTERINAVLEKSNV